MGAKVNLECYQVLLFSISGVNFLLIYKLQIVRLKVPTSSLINKLMKPVNFTKDVV